MFSESKETIYHKENKKNDPTMFLHELSLSSVQYILYCYIVCADVFKQTRAFKEWNIDLCYEKNVMNFVEMKNAWMAHTIINIFSR